MANNQSQSTYHAPALCPVCGQTMQVTSLSCSHCGTTLSGSFAPCRFCTLDEKNLQFVEVFLRCRGSIKEVEKALGVSYPTVKNMLDAALAALRLDDRPEPQEARKKEERSEILSRLSGGDMSVDAALEALKSLKGEK